MQYLGLWAKHFPILPEYYNRDLYLTFLILQTNSNLLRLGTHSFIYDSDDKCE